MGDKLKRYEKVEYLGEGQVNINLYMLYLLRQDMPLSFEIHFHFKKYTW
jgi:hypothetical protein